MNEQLLRTQLCDSARQLWQRGLIVADSGFLSVECHRQRYLVTPTGRRRSDLANDELQLVDLGGQYVSGEGVLPPDVWRPHRLSYRAQREPDPGVVETFHEIHATAMVEPPNTAALLRLKNAAKSIELCDLPPIPVIDADDETAVTEALQHLPALLVPPFGLLSVGPDMATVLNVLERIEHAATIELACMPRP